MKNPTDTEGRRPCGDGGRDGSCAATSQGMPESPEAGRGKKGSSPRGFEGMWPCQHLDFKLLASKTVREDISVFLSHPVGGMDIVMAAPGDGRTRLVLLPGVPLPLIPSSEPSHHCPVHHLLHAAGVECDLSVEPHAEPLSGRAVRFLASLHPQLDCKLLRAGPDP